MGSASMDSTHRRLKIFLRKYDVADVYYVGWPTMVASVLNMYRFLSSFPKQYSVTTLYIVVTLC